MQKALLIGAFMFAYGLAASAREPTLPHMPGPGGAPGADTQSAVAQPQRAAGTSGGTEMSSFDNERWLDKALDRKLLICSGCQLGVEGYRGVEYGPRSAEKRIRSWLSQGRRSAKKQIAPKIDETLIEDASPLGPFGAKGIGEQALTI